jgi:NAD(P)-dependent dehydrogenase (short-subunit alcohol dehydrogenase family)
MRGLEEKVIVIAGGGSGIGAATARRLAEEGAHVVVGDIDPSSATATAQAINTSGGRAIAVEFDIADPAAVEHLRDRAVEEFGGLDGWHNNAASITDDTMGRDLVDDAVTLPIDAWDGTFSVNLRGFWLGIRAAVPALVERGGGAIVNTASDAAFHGAPNLAAYSSSKAGMLALTRHVAARWGKDGVRCNVVSPGVVLTEALLEAFDQTMLDRALAVTNAPRLGRPEDIAATVTFLMSDDGSWINGQALSVNGGGIMR